MEINPAQMSHVRPLKPNAKSEAEQVKSAEKLRSAYRDFVGKTFYGQMLKSMRSTVGKAAYFDGGQTEQAFRSQLDQQLTDKMSEASAPTMADPLFRRQFPKQAELLAKHEKQQAGTMSSLDNLRRR